jgi:hypothetical membrane protein
MIAPSYTSHKTLWVAAIAWLLNIQYFLVQILVAATSTVPFSLRDNTISDLGNNVCGPYGERYVCSPDHMLMNISFVIVGLTIILGGAIFMFAYRNAWIRVGFLGLVVAGVGTIVVGLFPENTTGNYHALGASLPFFVGNISLIILGLSLKIRRLAAVATAAAGAVSMCALVLFMTHHYGPLGLGGMERIVAYPQTIWMICYAAWQLINSIRKRT